MSVKGRVGKLEGSKGSEWDLWVRGYDGFLTRTSTGERLTAEEFARLYPDAKAVQLRFPDCLEEQE